MRIRKRKSSAAALSVDDACNKRSDQSPNPLTLLLSAGSLLEKINWTLLEKINWIAKTLDINEEHISDVLEAAKTRMDLKNTENKTIKETVDELINKLANGEGASGT
eukprot:6984617-Prymnesium_polylepis.1